jgi:Holliday junction resolvase
MAKMNNRRRGDEFERRTRADLEKRGWVVVRSAGSLGPADLVALHHSRPPVIVSCKIPGYLRPTENDVLIETSLRAGAIPLLAYAKVDNMGAHVAYRQITKPKTTWGRTFMQHWATGHVRENGDDGHNERGIP